MRTVDARGLRCPLPLVKAKLAMEELAAGDELLVLATDPEAAIDLAAWAADAGHSLSERRGEGNWSEYVLGRDNLTSMSGPSPASERLRLALDFYETGERIMRARLRREQPGASDAEVEAALADWLEHHPGAERGDSAGRTRASPGP